MSAESGHEIRTVSSGHVFLESPRWHGGDLYVSDLFARTILRFPDGDGRAEFVSAVPGIPSGLGFLPDGEMLVVSMQDAILYRVRGAELVPYVTLRGKANGSPNDLLVDYAGRCYVGFTGHSPDSEADFGPSPLIIVQPNGEVVRSTDNFAFANGIVKPANDELLVAETYAGRIRSLALDSDGIPIAARDWAAWDPVTYFDIPRAHNEIAVEPDGLALGADGTVWVADAKGHGVYGVRPDGTVAEFIETGNLSVFGVAASDTRLFLCCAPTNRSVDWASLTSSELRVAELA